MREGGFYILQRRQFFRPTPLRPLLPDDAGLAVLALQVRW